MNSEYIKVFKAFTDENRVRILEILCEGEECACVLLDDLKISQPTLSHHMKILCESGIVRSRRKGKWNYYSINEDGCEYASQLLENIVKKHREGLTKIMSGFFRRRRAVLDIFGTCRRMLGGQRGMAQTEAGHVTVECCCCSEEENSREEQNAD